MGFYIYKEFVIFFNNVVGDLVLFGLGVLFICVFYFGIGVGRKEVVCDMIGFFFLWIISFVWEFLLCIVLNVCMNKYNV